MYLQFEQNNNNETFKYKFCIKKYRCLDAMATVK